jgi:glucosamine-6-phosphate deaminase
MKIAVYPTKERMGERAALHAAREIESTITSRGEAVIILATGTSQFETLKKLTILPGIRWECVVMFHLDEYAGIAASHPASFRKYIAERFVSKVGKLKAVYFINGSAADMKAECERLGDIIKEYTVDVALIGIGENGHIAFNDPPADFDTEDPFNVVELDEHCRRQQLGEGWFETLGEVPRRAISMSVRQIMKSKSIIASVPDRRKAQAVVTALEGKITNSCPASVLQRHPECTVYLDHGSASLLSKA